MPPKSKKPYKPYKKSYKKFSKKSQYKQQKLSVATVKKIAHNEVVKNAEVKRADYGLVRLPAYHNGGSTGVNGCAIYFLTDTAYLPQQGSGASQRLGNEIYASGWTVRFQINLPSDRLNTKFRVMVIRVNRGYSLSTYTQIFDNITGNIMIDPTDPERVKVVKSVYVGYKNINPGVPTTGKEVTMYRKIWIPFNKNIKFYDDNSQLNNLAYDYHLVAAAYDTYGSLVSDIVGYIQPWLRLSYKDL